MTPRQASKIIQAKLHELGLDYKTVRSYNLIL